MGISKSAPNFQPTKFNLVPLASKTEVRKSRYFSGNGLFATKNIPKGTFLVDGSVAGEPLSNYMNDANFKFPLDFSVATLNYSFNHYNKFERDPEMNLNNIRPLEGKQFQVLRDIVAGAELTRHYGMTRWALKLGCHILSVPEAIKSVVVDEIEDNDDDDDTMSPSESLQNLQYVMKHHGYNMSIHDISQTCKIV